MQIKLGIHESVIDRVKPGLKAIVTLPDRTLEANVSEVASVTRPAGWWTGNVVKYDTIIELVGEGPGEGILTVPRTLRGGGVDGGKKRIACCLEFFLRHHYLDRKLHHTEKILDADIVHIALYRSEYDLAVRSGLVDCDTIARSRTTGGSSRRSSHYIATASLGVPSCDV